jgi:hypothetical protein
MRRSYHHAIQEEATWMIHLDAGEYIMFNRVDENQVISQLRNFSIIFQELMQLELIGLCLDVII